MALSPVTLPPLEDDPSISDIFVDGPVGVNFVNGNMHLTFCTLRVDHNVQPTGKSLPQVRRVSLRMVIPAAGAVDLRNMIDNMVRVLREKVAQPQPNFIIPGPTTRQ